MTNEKVIEIIQDNNPGKEITCLIEFPDAYIYALDGDKMEGLVNWPSVNKETGELGFRSFFDLDDEHMKKII